MNSSFCNTLAPKSMWTWLCTKIPSYKNNNINCYTYNPNTRTRYANTHMQLCAHTHILTQSCQQGPSGQSQSGLSTTLEAAWSSGDCFLSVSHLNTGILLLPFFFLFNIFKMYSSLIHYISTLVFPPFNNLSSIPPRLCLRSTPPPFPLRTPKTINHTWQNKTW